SAVTLSGSGWQPGEAVRLLIQQSPKQHEDVSLTAKADSSGNVTTQYKLDSRNPDAVYYATASGSASEAQLRFAFTTASLNQCANGTLAAPTGCGASVNWVNGNVNGSKAHYFEGNFLPYRMVMTGLSAGSHQLTIQWDTTKGGRHALDYIGSYDATEPSTNGNNNPCAGVSGC